MPAPDIEGLRVCAHDTESQKRLAAEAAAQLVPAGARLGLGTGSTVAHLLPVLRGRDLRCVATSPATAQAARDLGLVLGELDELFPLDMAIDGTDQVDPHGWLVKGAGGAHTREKVVAVAARRFVVIASADKVVARIAPPIPLEILRFGAQDTLMRIGSAQLRDAPQTPDGNLLALYTGPVEDPGRLATWLSGTPGVVDHGLFSPEIVSDILIAGEDGLQRRRGAKGLALDRSS